jgi:hypothetical protein
MKWRRHLIREFHFLTFCANWGNYILDNGSQMSESAAGQVGAKVAIEITREMVRAGAEILAASSFCEMSQGIAEDVAEEILYRALGVAYGQEQSK